jgi:hypothetical protein
VHVQNRVVATCCNPWLGVSELDVINGKKVIFAFENGGLLKWARDVFYLQGAVLKTCSE